MTPIGSFSGVVHLVAQRPYVLAVVAVVAFFVAEPTTPLYLRFPVPSVVTRILPSSEFCQIGVSKSIQPGIKQRQIGNCYFRFNASEPKVVAKNKLDDTILYLKLMCVKVVQCVKSNVVNLTEARSR